MKYFLMLFVLIVAACSIPHSYEPYTSQNGIEALLPTKGRYQLKSPESYRKLLPRAESFFLLVQTDQSVSSQKFLGTHLNPENIIAAIKASEDFPVQVKTYGWWKDRYSKVLAYHENGTIYLNSYKILRPECEVINTLVHEYMHRLGFSHATNRVKGQARDMSVPYWFGDKAEEYCLRGLI